MNGVLQLIGAALGGGAVTGFFTVVGIYLTNKHKIRLLKTQYQQKLDESYREQARKYIVFLYRPLNKLIFKLNEKYSMFTYRNEKKDYSNIEPKEIMEAQEAIEAFLNEISVLLGEGDSGYLTPQLDSELKRFIGFLTRSMHTGKPSDESEWISFSEQYYDLMPWLFSSPTAYQEYQGFKYYAKYAPIGSIDFNKRFFDEVEGIQTIIRKVMLKNQT